MSAANTQLQFSAPRWLYFAIFAISGFSGLIYESIWTHYLKLFLGHAAYAQSLVLSIFMGGMALGAWIAGRFSKHWRTPILVYAIVEAVIGLIALFFHESFVSIVNQLYNVILPQLGSPLLGNSLKWSIASLIIIPQSVLLGMTFPLMSTGIIRKYPDSKGGSIAMLYFTNSIGAALGVLASGFWLIEAVGLPGTIMTAGLINIALALGVWVLFKCDPQPYSEPLTEQPNNRQDAPPIMLFITAAFITGAASFIYEIGWIRMLSLVLGSSTHAFELMLSAFITGIAFGGLWIKRRIDSINNPIQFSGYVQIIMGGLALLTIPIYLQTFEWMAFLKSALTNSEAGYQLYFLSSHIIALIVMVPTTFLAGMTLPLFTYTLLKKGYGEKSIGQIYAANTVGAIAGILFAVHIGMPGLSLKYLIVFGASLDIVLGFFLLYKSQSQIKIMQHAPIFGLCAIIFVSILTLTSFDKATLASGVFRYGNTRLNENREILFYQDGKTSTVSIEKTGEGRITIANNGKPDASINLAPDEPPTFDEVTMISLGAFPFAYKPDAKLIANIGLGSGMTTHTILSLEQIERVDTIEIEQAVVDAAPLFSHKVARAFNDSRSHIHIEDAKTFFSTRNTQYDIIISEPSNPWVSGISSLFTQEFYQFIHGHLVDDGVFAQWMHLYEMEPYLIASVLKAMSTAFEDFVIFNANDADIIILAKKTGRLQSVNFEKLFASNLSNELNAVNIRKPIDINLRLLATKNDIANLFYKNPIKPNSDFFPLLDLYAIKAFIMGSNAYALNAMNYSLLPKFESVQQEHISTQTATSSKAFTRSQLNHYAWTIFNQLINDEKTDGPEDLPRNLQDSLLVVKLMTQNCKLNQHPNEWLQHWHIITKSILPYLDKPSAMRVFANPAWGHCVNEMPLEVKKWVQLYQAIAAGDANSMTIIATDLLATEKDIDKNRKEYLLHAALLGNITHRNYSQANALWKTYANSIYATSGEVPDVLMLDKYQNLVPSYIIALVNAAQRGLDLERSTVSNLTTYN